MPSAANGPDGHRVTTPEPAVLFVLACPLPGAEGRPGYLLHRIGSVDCVLGYTDLTRLVECCGPHQPWLAVQLDALVVDLRDQKLAGPVVNLPLNSDSRWGEEGPPWDLAALVPEGSDHAAGQNGGAQ